MNDFLTKRVLKGDPFPASSAASGTPSPTPLPFELDATSRQHIAEAEKEFATHIAPYDVHYTMYTRYGKEGIKKMKTSPDGWCQMLFQLAYYLTVRSPVLARCLRRQLHSRVAPVSSLAERAPRTRRRRRGDSSSAGPRRCAS